MMFAASASLAILANVSVALQADHRSKGMNGSPSTETGTREVTEAESVYCSTEFTHPVNVLDYFPLQVGTRWAYRHTTKDRMGPQRAMITVQWIEEVEILEHLELPEGKLIVRKSTVRDVTCDAADEAREKDVAWCRDQPSRRDETHYLIQGNYVFLVGPIDLDLARTGRLRVRYRRSQDGHDGVPPSFFFPIDKVRVWAERARERRLREEIRRWEARLGPAPNPGNNFWHVMGREDVVVPYGRVAQAAHLRYGTLGGPSEVWFTEGIGVVRETVRRQRDYLSRAVVLLSFAPPKANGTGSDSR
jgi:hypothetical protein